MGMCFCLFIFSFCWHCCFKFLFGFFFWKRQMTPIQFLAVYLLVTCSIGLTWWLASKVYDFWKLTPPLIECVFVEAAKHTPRQPTMTWWPLAIVTNSSQHNKFLYTQLHLQNQLVMTPYNPSSLWGSVTYRHLTFFTGRFSLKILVTVWHQQNTKKQ